MKLSKIYCNKDFKTVKFNGGLNVVLAKVANPKKKDEDSHNLGKTSLIELIDFLLLKGVKKSHTFKKHLNKFSDHIFYLEIELNNSNFLTVKRPVANHNCISFKEHRERNLNFVSSDEWDVMDLNFTKSKKYLEEKLGFDVLEEWDFRKSVTYFLRNQYDYKDVFQLSKFSSGNHIYWKPFMFDLLGFDGVLPKKKYELDKEKEELNNIIKEFQNKFSVSSDEADKIKGAIEIKVGERDNLDEQINRFSFYEKERGLNRELVEEIETEISELNEAEYQLDYEIEKLKDSIESKFDFDINLVETLFKEVNIFFPEQLKSDYQQLLEFNSKITRERNDQLENRLKLVVNKRREILRKLNELDNKRVEVLSFLRGTDTFGKFKNYQNALTKIETEIVRLEEKLKNIDKIKGLRDEIRVIDTKIDEKVREIDKSINNQNNIYKDIRKNFSSFIKKVINAPAIIFLQLNGEGNVEFFAEIQDKNRIDITSESKGFSYKKMLCMAFDLALLVTYSNRSFYRFAYHDGSLEGLDNRKKIIYIDTIRELCNEYNIQYIFTSIEDDLPTDENGKSVILDSEIAVTLDDSGDEGKLYKMSF